MVRLVLFADYFQIHVFDENSQTDLGNYWNDRAALDGFAAAEDALAIGTLTNFDVLVDVDIIKPRQGGEMITGECIFETSILVSSGRMVVMGCTDFLPGAQRFDVPAGWVLIRGARDVVPDLGAEGPDVDDYLRLQVWPTADHPHG